MNKSNREPQKLKEVMEKENLKWRSFVHDEAVLVSWNKPGTPKYYIIDHKGVIRYKWTGNPGSKTMDAALEEVIHDVGK